MGGFSWGISKSDEKSDCESKLYSFDAFVKKDKDVAGLLCFREIYHSFCSFEFYPIIMSLLLIFTARLLQQF